MAFTVSDSGIGIPNDKHASIFEAFQQADGTTSRANTGGMGPRPLDQAARSRASLGGEIRVESEPGARQHVHVLPAADSTPPVPMARALSTTTLAGLPQPMLDAPSPATIVVSQPFEDDRDDLQPGDRLLLVIEDDPTFARILRDAARAPPPGPMPLVALEGDTGLRARAQVQAVGDHARFSACPRHRH